MPPGWSNELSLPGVTINYVAVLVAALSNMVVGFVWYAPPVFGDLWMKAIGKSKADLKKAQAVATGVMAVGALLFSYILAHFVGYVSANTWAEAAQLALWVWLGFVVPVTAGSTFFGGQSRTAWLIGIGYQLVALFVAATILALWP